MATNIEIEVKVLLDEKDFEKVNQTMAKFNPEEICHTNHYIDTDINGRLKQYGIALRVREVDDQFELTLKTPLAEAILEKSQDLTSQEFKDLQEKDIFPDGHIFDFIESLGIDPTNLKVLAAMKTNRRFLEYKGYNFSMDRNEYSDVIDYELEMAGSSLGKAEELLREICNFAGVPFIINHRSKQARAIAKIKK